MRNDLATLVASYFHAGEAMIETTIYVFSAFVFTMRVIQFWHMRKHFHMAIGQRRG